jgi:hypothetical protein
LTETIPIRLTPTQMSVIWPGLDLIVLAESSRRTKGSAHYEYPFRIYPKYPGFDRGHFHPELMNVIVSLWKRLRGREKRGGRIQVNDIELRAAVFAVRTTMAHFRKRDRGLRKRISLARETWRDSERESLRKSLANVQVDIERYFALRKEGVENARKQIAETARYSRRARQTISSLERHAKRANRLLRKRSTPAQYEALMQMWREHLRWMRLHLVYFAPPPPVWRPKRWRQRNLDILTEMAIRGLKNEGYAPPEPVELRRVLRLYVRSSNRGRERLTNSVPEMLKYPDHFMSKWFLARWVISRTHVERLA